MIVLLEHLRRNMDLHLERSGTAMVGDNTSDKTIGTIRKGAEEE